MKKSAGVLPYKIENNDLYVYLEKPGGPFWKNKDSWSICKGEYNKESSLDAAVREFREESGFDVNRKDLEFLCSIKMKTTNKLVTVFIVNQDFDADKMKSNTFIKEWPIGSGKMCEFPEMIEGKWFEIKEAKNKVFKGQIKILEKLEEYIWNK